MALDRRNGQRLVEFRADASLQDVERNHVEVGEGSSRGAGLRTKTGSDGNEGEKEGEERYRRFHGPIMSRGRRQDEANRDASKGYRASSFSIPAASNPAFRDAISVGMLRHCSMTALDSPCNAIAAASVCGVGAASAS